MSAFRYFPPTLLPHEREGYARQHGPGDIWQPGRRPEHARRGPVAPLVRACDPPAGVRVPANARKLAAAHEGARLTYAKGTPIQTATGEPEYRLTCTMCGGDVKLLTDDVTIGSHSFPEVSCPGGVAIGELCGVCGATPGAKVDGITYSHKRPRPKCEWQEAIDGHPLVIESIRVAGRGWWTGDREHMWWAAWEDGRTTGAFVPQVGVCKIGDLMPYLSGLDS